MSVVCKRINHRYSIVCNGVDDGKIDIDIGTEPSKEVVSLLISVIQTPKVIKELIK